MTARIHRFAWAVILVAGLSFGVQADRYNRTVLVVNDTSQTITHFYGSNTGAQDWEEDILDDEVLEAGEEVEINFDDDTGYCLFDFLAVLEDGSRHIEERFNVCDYGTITFTD